MNWLEFVGDTLEILGGILIALAVIAVHDTEVKERQIDEAVYKSIRKEHVLVFVGISLLIIGFLLNQIGRLSS